LKAQWYDIVELMDEHYLKTRFSKSDSLVFRKIAQESILVPIRRRAGETEDIYTLNEVGARIWELVDGTRTVEQIRDVIVEEYEVSTQEAEKDLIELLGQLEQIGALNMG
jgi:hypothetical protein